MLLALMIMAESFYVATYIDADPNSIREAAAVIEQYRKATSSEAGSQRVDVIQEISRPNRWVVIEAWADESSFDAHEKGSATASFRDKIKAIQNSPYDQRVHHAWTVGTPPAAAVGRDALSVVTHIDVPPPRREEAEALLKTLAEASRRESGNVRYDVYQQYPARTNHFTVFAVWKDRTAFDAHDASVHTRRFREALGPMLGALYDERLYNSAAIAN
jgi:quinol monooxygenase YgiN